MVFLVCVYLIPISPVYLMTKGKEAEAEKVVNLLGHDASTIEKIKASMKKDDESQSKYFTIMALFSQHSNRKPFLIGLTVMLFFQVPIVMQWSF